MYHPDEQNNSLFADMNKIKQWERDGELSVEFQEKYNGKFVLFAFLHINENTYIFGGSKNCHELHRFDKQIDACSRGCLTCEILNFVKNDFEVNHREIMYESVYFGEYVDGKLVPIADGKQLLLVLELKMQTQPWVEHAAERPAVRVIINAFGMEEADRSARAAEFPRASDEALV